MGIKSMQGTPAHLEYIGPHGRKYRTSCIYNQNKVCFCRKAQCYLNKCVGRLNCDKFDDRKGKITQSNEKIGNRKRENYNSQVKSNILGKKFKLKSLRTMEEIVIEIVGPNRVSTINRRYSVNSNFGRALQGKTVGDRVTVNITRKYLRYIIIDIK